MSEEKKPALASQSDAIDFALKWQRWFDEVNRLEPEPSTVEADEYGELLIEKYKQQGLELLD